MKTCGTESSPWLPPGWLKTLVKSGNPVNMFMAEVSMAMLPGPCPDVLQRLVGVVLGQCSCMLVEKHGEADSVLI